jgi:tetratricopeptide (TPR) repeat protein
MADPDAKMVEAITFFEKMLQTMPDDRTSLEFLSVAYEQTGQVEKRRDCLIQLADCLLHEKDYENAQSIAMRLNAFKDYEPARTAIERVAESVQRQILKDAQDKAQESRVQKASVGVSGSGAFQDTGLEIHALSRTASAAEMELVWFWKEQNFLAKEICMDILHILTESQIADQPLLISAFALADEQHPELTERLMESMQRASNMPPIPLELFEVQPAAVKELSSAFIHVKGTLPFALLGGEVLIAVLNPMNKALQEEIVSRVGKPCHFFLAHPKVWQEAAGKV